MDTTENTAKLVDITYKNIIEEFGPCTKQLVNAGRTYLKSLQAMVAASRQYTDALTRVAALANKSTLRGSADIGSTIHDIIDVNKEILAQQTNIIKSLEFDFLEPMEIAADKDTKLVGREQKRFQQLYKGRREAYMKCISTLKKTRRKKNINTDKQLSQMRMLESAKERLEVFCDDSLKEAMVQERIMYGTVLERQCALNRQFLIYHNQGCQLLEEKLPQWESAAGSREKLPDSSYMALSNGKQLGTLTSGMEAIYSLDEVIRNNSIARSYGRRDRDSVLSHHIFRFDEEALGNIYARPLVRAKSEYCLPTSASPPTFHSDMTSNRFSRALTDYGGGSSETETCYVRALYPYEPTGDHQLALREGDVVEYITEDSNTGWQFGDNLTTKRSGWFPLSYTEPIKDLSKLFMNGNAEDDSPRPPPPPPPATIASVRSKVNIHQETSEYATLTRAHPRRPLPVSPPTVHANFPMKNGDSGRGTTKSMNHYASHPNIVEANSHPEDKPYYNGQQLSMRL